MDLIDRHPIVQARTTGDATKSICIIGGGPAGLGALKVIVDTPQFKSGEWVPALYEAREQVGGVWLPAPPTDDPPLTPLYDSLTTNLPHPVMAYESFSFPPSTAVFPHHPAVQRYLEAYAEHFNLLPHIHTSTIVFDARWETSRWIVKLSTGETRDFDFVVVANGHYRVPRYPDVPGISEWQKAGKVMHSAWYRKPHNLGNVVLVVGGGPSGQDITAEMSEYASTVIHSLPGVEPGQNGKVKVRGRIAEFKSDGVIFEDGSIEHGVDFCILATGYEFAFPFLSQMKNELPQPVPPLPSELYNSSWHIFPLAQHIFPLQTTFPPHSIAFLGLVLKVAPFPMIEAQARAMVKVFAHPESLDVTQGALEIVSRYDELSKEFHGDQLQIAAAFHRFVGHEQFQYRDDLHRFAGYGDDTLVQDWVKEMYDKKDILRRAWRELERSGKADEWVKDVGEGGPHEWVELLKRLLRHAEEKGEVEIAVENQEAKL
ncbi:FAD/NAD(P)-binding domain-containing protein [Punctularia strigosozonata HHB-11173 SS5]|uniref:FAD/NAD(P)-binding domain-containing protein n=1 Tax=Punctularia strigosozonata (strain HHB-11173) TaxID=741275 RepID=UPI0004417E73|nr:FAD/NAD(P)-binding domain-containing protein [Punctularia strigosozonata HHB-11173 SS5]EIN08431.1 FAD/NAD(P)-binding domain-containing protein [Punctularia strigosozonata HHB-11173 SS5]